MILNLIPEVSYIYVASRFISHWLDFWQCINVEAYLKKIVIKKSRPRYNKKNNEVNQIKMLTTFKWTSKVKIINIFNQSTSK